MHSYFFTRILNLSYIRAHRLPPNLLIKNYEQNLEFTMYLDTCDVVNSGKCIYYGTTAETFSVSREVKWRQK